MAQKQSSNKQGPPSFTLSADSRVDIRALAMIKNALQPVMTRDRKAEIEQAMRDFELYEERYMR